MKVCVVGAGVVGLTTALRISEQFPAADISVVAEKRTKDTTSHGAAGLFRPTFSRLITSSEAEFRKWVGDSWKFYSSLQRSNEGPLAGCSILDGYMCYTTAPTAGELTISDIIYDWKAVDPAHCPWLHNAERYQAVFSLKTLLIEGRMFLPWLENVLQKRGIEIVSGNVSSLSSLYSNYDVIVNCAGLNGGVLAGEPQDESYPVRGSLIRVEAPWLKYFVYVDNMNFYFPVRDGVVLGGVRQRGEYGRKIMEEDRNYIWEKILQIEPTLQHAKVQEEWCGLRPFRKGGVRVEVEQITVGGSRKIILHNYGHGANGMSLSYGTAVAAVQLLETAVRKSTL